MIYLLTAVGLPPGGSNTVHVYTQIITRTTQSTQTIHRTTQLTNWKECGPCPVFARYTLSFALQLRKKHGKNLSQGNRRVPLEVFLTVHHELTLKGVPGGMDKTSGECSLC